MSRHWRDLCRRDINHIHLVDDSVYLSLLHASLQRLRRFGHFLRGAAGEVGHKVCEEPAFSEQWSQRAGGDDWVLLNLPLKPLAF